MAALPRRPVSPWRGISCFSGCGGSSLGYRLGGIRMLWANEFIPIAAESYRANFPETLLDSRDIRTITPAEILAALGLDRGDLDLVDGSPPCAAFSTAGRRAAFWGEVRPYSETRQRTDDLFEEFARLVGGLVPRVFVAENVAGLVSGVGRGQFKAMLTRFERLGYRVGARLLDAQWLGVPQHRARLFFVGVRRDLDRPPAFPDPWPVAIPLRAALADLDAPIEPETDISRFAIGRRYDGVRRGGDPIRGTGTRAYFSLVRPRWSKPCPTLTAKAADPTAASVVHPDARRKFSVAEARRICGFPDDFVLCGSYEQRIERLGRAVPPPVTAALATAIRRGIFDEPAAPAWWEAV